MSDVSRRTRRNKSATIPGAGVYGRAEAGQIVIHSRKEGRYRCKRCGKTFSATTGTPFDRLHHPQALVVIVVTLLAFGCPVQAIVAAFGLDERTVADWQRRAGRQGSGCMTPSCRRER